MKTDLLDLLRCPQSGQRLKLADGSWRGDKVEAGWLVSDDDRYRYPIVGGIPRFVADSNYADNFGMQWNMFRKTQLDSHSGHAISADRFWKATGWLPSELRDQWVLDVGCGAGRFAEVALNAGARVVAVDYSKAVDACYANLGHHPKLDVVQGDIYALPFARATFSYVYSLGVLQHTPDVAKAFAALPAVARKGGKLCVDYYLKSWKNVLRTKYWLRPIMKRLPKPVLFALLKKTLPVLLPVARASRSIPVLGAGLSRMMPVASYYGVYPLNQEQQKEWALLDTFDWYSPQFDRGQTETTVRSWMEKAGLREIEVLKAGHLVARGIV